MEHKPKIKTPDQRLRVFVSSTLDELSEERTAATDAIRALRLSPVLFESGARPHAPREVYRAYLAQSHIFIGIYWQSYGWVAPDMEISGIEDELALARDMPKLIYIKRPAPERDPRLDAMLDRFRSGESISYRPFETAAELRDLIKDDLVIMLTERFEEGSQGSTTPTPPAPITLPSFVNRFVGRESEMAEVTQMLVREDVRLVTLTGPGGIGKSRLALEAGAALRDRFGDGVHLVTLESVADPSLVLSTIASTLEVTDSLNMFGDALVQYLRNRNVLLILDNLEQVLSAAPELVHLLEECPHLKLLVTSRIVLNVRGEREIPVPLLGLPENDAADVAALERSEAVQLFVARVRGSDPSFELTGRNAAAVAEICKRLDGLPLALELAAARARLFPPEILLRRLDDRFNLLTGGAADLPERHRALRATIAWSFDLLGESERDLFIRLSVFRGGWSLDAAEAVCGTAGRSDILTDIQALLDSSLVRLIAEEDEPRFSMLETVRDFAADLLEKGKDAATVREAHAAYFLDLADSAGEGLRTSEQSSWLKRLEADHDNIRAGFRWHLAHGGAERVANAAWSLWMFWWIRSHLTEGLRCMNSTLRHSENLSRSGRARASAVAGVMHFWRAEFGEAVSFIAPSLEEFRELDDQIGIALCQLALGFMEASVSDPATAFARFDEARGLFEEQDDLWGQTLSLNAICWLALSLDVERFEEGRFRQAVRFAEEIGVEADLAMALGNLGRRHLFRRELASAEDLMSQALQMFAANSVLSSASYILDAFGELAVLRNEHQRAAVLFGSAEAMRRASNFPLLPFLRARWERWTDRLKDEIGEEAFEVGYEQGLQMTVDEAVAFANPVLVESN